MKIVAMVWRVPQGTEWAQINQKMASQSPLSSRHIGLVCLTKKRDPARYARFADTRFAAPDDGFWREIAGRLRCCERQERAQKQPKRGRLWLNDGSCVRLRPAHKGHVWSYDFVQDRTHDGKVFRMLCVIDEYTRECLAIRVERRLNSRDVLDVLGELFVRHGAPEHIRSDNVLHTERDQTSRQKAFYPQNVSAA